MSLERLPSEPFKVVFLENDAIQLRSKEGKVVTFAIAPEQSRDGLTWVADKYDTYEAGQQKVAPRLINMMFIDSAEKYPDHPKVSDNGSSDTLPIEEIVRRTEVPEKELQAMIRFAQKKLFDGFVDRARQRKEDNA